jgi:MFS family permease
LFIGDSLTTLLFSIIVWLGVPETLPSGTKDSREQHQQGYLRTALSDPLLWSYSLLALLFNCIYVQWSVALPIDMRAHGLNVTSYGIIAAVNAFLVVVIGLPMTALFTRVSRNMTLAIATLMLGLGMGLYSWTHSLAGYTLGVLIWTCGEIIYYPLSTALIAAISPTHLRGIYQGFFGISTSLSSLIAPILGGIILQYLGSTYLWTCCLAMGILIACVYLVLGKVQQAMLQIKSRSANRPASN